MSHKANYWLAKLDPSLIKAGAFRVLFHLCDHHNDSRDPGLACFPSQETLKEKTGMSNGALNNALNDMEAAGLIRRRRSTAPGSRERRTYYILGCDFQALDEQTPENGDCVNSPEQTPVFEVTNSSLGRNKLQPTGEEPVRTERTGKGTSRPTFHFSEDRRPNRVQHAKNESPRQQPSILDQIKREEAETARKDQRIKPINRCEDHPRVRA